jgi:hypothetical protein
LRFSPEETRELIRSRTKEPKLSNFKLTHYQVSKDIFDLYIPAINQSFSIMGYLGTDELILQPRAIGTQSADFRSTGSKVLGKKQTCRSFLLPPQTSKTRL